MSKTHWKQLINPDYLGVYSLPEGNDMTVTIDKIVRESITSDGGRKEDCTVARIKNNKPMILNRTNQKTIARMYGPYIEDWAGKSVTLFASTTELKKELVECLRIRPQPPRKPKLSDERFNAAMAKIEAGEYTREQLVHGFDLTPEQLKQATETGGANNENPA